MVRRAARNAWSKSRCLPGITFQLCFRRVLRRAFLAAVIMLRENARLPEGWAGLTELDLLADNASRLRKVFGLGLMLSLSNLAASPLLSKIAAVWRFLTGLGNGYGVRINVSLSKPWGEARLSYRLRGARVGGLRPVPWVLAENANSQKGARRGVKCNAPEPH